MKRLLFLFYIPALFAFAACNGNGDDENGGTPDVPEELKKYVKLDLSEHGLPFVMMIPDTLVGMPEITVQPYGETEVRVGDYFQVKIAVGGDMKLKRTDLAEDLLYKSTYIEEEENAIMYKSALPDGSNEFIHFYVIVNVDGVEYEVMDIEEGDNYPEIAIKRMMESAKFIQPVKKEEPKEEDA